MNESLGATPSPESEEITQKGGEPGTPAGAVHVLRSPAYASFEVLESSDEDVDAKRGGASTGGELAAEIEKTITSFEEGQIVRGKVSQIRESEIIVDVGFKSEGTIAIGEFRNVGEIHIDDEFDVYLEKLENQDGLVVLSKEKADFFKVWGEIKDAHDTGNIMYGTVKRRIKGGLVVDLLGVDAFLPGSQIALRQVPNLDDLIGDQLEFKIIKINKRRRNIVVSRRVVLEERRAEQKRQLMTELEVGQVREGVVKNITDFGAFVDLGGVDGLLHLTDMTWGRISHPSEVVAIGDTLQVKVLDFDKEKEKISLGLKQLQPYPWEGVERRYPIGKIVQGTVVSITDYGAFVELEKGVEGLIHISEMSWTKHVKHPSKIVSVSETVEAMVLKVDEQNQKISLGLKQTEPDPWTQIEDKYPVGTRIRGIVRNLTNFGAFVEIEEGIDGLLHISDMSWAKRVRHPSEVVKKGELVDVVVLDISQDKKRISLGMKQLTENPWDQLAVEFSVDTEVQGTITRILDRGAVVELRSDVEGFVPVGQMGIEGLGHPEEYFDVGGALPLHVIKIDPKNKRIVLSVTAWMKAHSEEEVQAFLEAHPRRERVETEEQPAPEADRGSGDAIDATDEDADSDAGTDAAATEAAEATEEAPETTEAMETAEPETAEAMETAEPETAEAMEAAEAAPETAETKVTAEVESDADAGTGDAPDAEEENKES